MDKTKAGQELAIALTKWRDQAKQLKEAWKVVAQEEKAIRDIQAGHDGLTEQLVKLAGMVGSDPPDRYLMLDGVIYRLAVGEFKKCTIEIVTVEAVPR